MQHSPPCAAFLIADYFFQKKSVFRNFRQNLSCSLPCRRNKTKKEGQPSLPYHSTENESIMLTMTNKTSKFERIFDLELMPHADALYNFSYHLTSNEEDANDLFQEAMMKAWRFIDRYEEGTNAKAWLFTIAKNAFINDYRKRVKTPNKVELQDFITHQDREDTPLTGSLDMREEMFSYLMGDEVTMAINTLAVEFRTVILLCDIEDFTYEEIAKILDIPIGTVRSRLFRARNELKKKLKEYAENLGFEDKRG